MRLALHWRGRPLLAVDVTAHTPDDEPTDGPTLQATAGGQFDTATTIEPDTHVFGYSQRPESLR